MTCRRGDPEQLAGDVRPADHLARRYDIEVHPPRRIDQAEVAATIDQKQGRASKPARGQHRLVHRWLTRRSDRYFATTLGNASRFGCNSLGIDPSLAAMSRARLPMLTAWPTSAKVAAFFAADFRIPFCS